MSLSLFLQGRVATGLLILLVAGGVSCGKRKPPLPPIPKVEQRAQISGFQRGEKVLISWRMPERNAPAGDVQHISRIDVYRLAEKLSSPQGLTEQQFSARSVLVASIKVKDADFGDRPMSFTDTLQFAGQSSRMRYAIRFVNSSGQKAAFSNFLLIEPEPRVAAAPQDLEGNVSQESITLKWTAPTANTDGTTPINLIGFNIYRSGSKTQAGKLLTLSPVKESEFEDKNFEFGKPYYYFVRAVSAGAGKSTESSESNIIELNPIDTFAPGPPSSITIAAAPGTISLFFPPNPEPDIAGYKIFRSEDPLVEKSEWKLLTASPIDRNTFQDTDIDKGKSYFYYLKAIDRFGNESDASEVVSEKAL